MKALRIILPALAVLLMASCELFDMGPAFSMDATITLTDFDGQVGKEYAFAAMTESQYDNAETAAGAFKESTVLYEGTLTSSVSPTTLNIIFESETLSEGEYYVLVFVIDDESVIGLLSDDGGMHTLTDGGSITLTYGSGSAH